MKPKADNAEYGKVDFFTDEYYRLKEEGKIDISADLEEAVKNVNCTCTYFYRV